MSSRGGKWGAGLVILLALILILVNWTNWNLLKGPISRTVKDKTGRQLVIGGDLIMHLGWPFTRINTQKLSFANPDWAQTPYMVAVDEVNFTLHIPSLLKGAIVVDEVHLNKANVALEKSVDGRKNWLLDRNQKNENSRLQINALAVNAGLLSYKDPLKKTDIHAELSTTLKPTHPDAALSFKADGKYLALPLKAQGTGGSLLSLRDKELPYPIDIDATVGPTSLSAAGRITSLLKFTAIDLRIKLRGGSLAQLFPLIGVVLPDTPSYQTKGRLIRQAQVWRYEKFNGQIGKSDISGSLSVDTAPTRPLLSGHLNSKKLNFADLGPLVGAKQPEETADNRNGRILPNTPFRTERWKKMDADVTLKADSIIRNKALPINDLSTHLRLRNSVLTLDPLKFGIAGGTLAGLVKLDGSTPNIQAITDLKARRINIAQLFPTLERAKSSIGQVNGDIDLKGRGNTVASMLATSNGRFVLVASQGEISKLMMEAVGLHILEMLQLKLSGDKNVQIHCGIADFGVKQGVMIPRTLMLDTDITRITGSGSIDMGTEQLDLTVVQKSKKLSLISLRPPIHIRGRFAKPTVSLDKGKLVARGLGAVVLGVINPVLALIPLVETGKDTTSECATLNKTRTAPKNNAAIH